MAKNLLGLDMKKFKVGHSDDKSTTLHHDDGHSLTIQHNTLAKHNQEILKSLSKVGKENQTQSQAREAQNQKPKAAANGGPVPHNMPQNVTGYAEGGQADSGKVPIPPREDPTTQEKMRQVKEGAEKGFEMPSIEELVNRVKHAMAEGGRVPVPPKEQSQPQNSMSQAKEGATKPFEMPSSDELINRVKNAWAEGGHVAAHKILFADGGMPDIGDVKSAMTQMPQEQDPDQQFYQEEYNKAKQGAEAVAPIAKFFGKDYNPEMVANKEALDSLKVHQEKQKEQAADVMKTDAQAGQINLQRQQMGLPPMPGTMTPPSIPNTSPEEQKVMAENLQPMANQEQAPEKPLPPAGVNDFEGMINQGYQAEKAGAQQRAEAIGQLAQEQIPALQQQQEALRQSQQAYKMSYDQLEQERQAHMQDIRDGHIDPNKYWQDHSKVATGIGMILAGFNPTNSPNAAIDMLKFNIEKSVQAQQQNLNAKNNMLTANLHQFGNLRDAQDMTRLLLADNLKAQLDQASAKAASPLAKAEALKAIGEINKTYAPLAMQMSMRRALLGLTSHGGSPQAVEQTMQYMDVMNPGSSKSYRERYVPGFAGTSGPFAAVPVPDSARNELSAFQNVDRLINEAQGLAKKPWTSLSISERQRGGTLMNELQSAIRTAESQGVYKESEAKFMNSTIGSNPAGMLAGMTTAHKLSEMQKIKRAEYLQKAAQYGLRPQSMPSSNSNQEGMSGVSKSGRPMILQNGQWHYK